MDIHTYQATEPEPDYRPCLRGAILATRPGDDTSHRAVIGRSAPIYATHLKPWPCRSNAPGARH